ncbi:MAG: hypothetical protein FJX20_23410 [Alphaproteobacteria bacterium]|nr:hypothetical protein [Alphaproteobacteria bacterium]
MPSGSRPSDRHLSVEEADRLISIVAAHLRPAIITALYTGLRLANVVALDWSDINLRARTITVRVRLWKPGGKVLTVPIAMPLLADLAPLGLVDTGSAFTYRGRAVAKMRKVFSTALGAPGSPISFGTICEPHVGEGDHWRPSAGTPVAQPVQTKKARR